MKHQEIEFYHHPAGGWSALKSTAHQLLSQSTATESVKTVLPASQPDGLGYPGCVWSGRDHASTFEFCENGVKAVAAEATSHRTIPELFTQYTMRELAEWPDYVLEDQGRLTHPMVYGAGNDKYILIDRDTVFTLIARYPRMLPDPNRVIFYTSGRTSNEVASLYQLFVRAYGTSNFPDYSNMCHEPSDTGTRTSIGVGKGTVTLDDFTKIDTIFILGRDSETNHLCMFGELCEASKRGTSIVSFSPLRRCGLERFADPQSKIEMLTLGSMRISTGYHQVRIGGDLATVKGTIKHVIECDDTACSRGEPAIIDHTFIAQHTGSHDAFAADVHTKSWVTIEVESGLPEHEIRQTDDAYIKAGSVIACRGMGIMQHRHSAAMIQMIVDLLLLRGNIECLGVGTCPMRGHNNVQGDRTMGTYEKPAPALLDRLEEVFSIQMPREHGYDTVGAIETMQQDVVCMFPTMDGDFVATTPDTAATWAGLYQRNLTAHVTAKLDHSHIVYGKAALILSCLGRTEVDQQTGGAQGVTVEDSMSMMHMSAGTSPPTFPHLFSEPTIVARLAEATLPESIIPQCWLIESCDCIHERIGAVFNNFASLDGKIHVSGDFRLRSTASERVWNTPSGKVEFHAHAVPTDIPVHRTRERHADAIVFMFATVCSHDQYDTTIYGMDDRYRGVLGQRRVVSINKGDLHTIRMKGGEQVDMMTPSEDGTTRRADGFRLAAHDIPHGYLTVYYPETNPLVPPSFVADQTRTPTSKSISVMLVPSQIAYTTNTQAATTAEA